MSLLPALRTMTGLAAHVSVNWDIRGQCEDAICSVCGGVFGVSSADGMLRHGPTNQPPCRGTGGPTTVPRLGPGNARRALLARNRALAGRPLARGKR